MAHAKRERADTTGAKQRIPKFDTVQEAAEFWDTHDSAEFEDEFEDIEDEIHFIVSRGAPKKAITVRLAQDTLDALTHRAREEGVSASALVRMWIVERLRGRNDPEP
jgi:predicted DNA binding CopG/RHH family protein